MPAPSFTKFAQDLEADFRKAAATHQGAVKTALETAAELVMTRCAQFAANVQQYSTAQKKLRASGRN